MKIEEVLKMGRFPSQKQKAVLNLMYSAWWLKTLISKELKLAGLTLEQYNVMRILKGKHPQAMCVRDIGCRMIERSSNVPRIIDRLVAKKSVSRSTSEVDKRETAVKLTEAGLETLASATKKVDRLFGNSVVLKEDEAALLNSLLENMRQTE